MFRCILIIFAFALMAACTSTTNDEVLQSAITTPVTEETPVPETQIAGLQPTQSPQELPLIDPQNPSQPIDATPLAGVNNGEPQSQPIPPSPPGGVQPVSVDQRQFAFATDGGDYQPVLQPRPRVTYLINGLASSVPSIGYGFTNLSKKIPGSVLYNYASFVESSTIIRSRITRDLKAAYRRDPSLEINMVGISFGANIVTLIAADLDRAGIPVNYLVTMEGPAMVPIGKNVRIADNFSCTNLDCFRTKSRLSNNNNLTRFATFKIRTSHIPLADHPDVHNRILSQIRARDPQPLVVVQ